MRLYLLSTSTALAQSSSPSRFSLRLVLELSGSPPNFQFWHQCPSQTTRTRSLFTSSYVASHRWVPTASRLRILNGLRARPSYFVGKFADRRSRYPRRSVSQSGARLYRTSSRSTSLKVSSRSSRRASRLHTRSSRRLAAFMTRSNRRHATRSHSP